MSILHTRWGLPLLGVEISVSLFEQLGILGRTRVDLSSSASVERAQRQELRLVAVGKPRQFGRGSVRFPRKLDLGGGGERLCLLSSCVWALNGSG